MTDIGFHQSLTATRAHQPASQPPYSNDQPRREGWGIFDCGVREDGTQHRELQRIDCPDDGQPPFGDDGAVWDHVVAQARSGSTVHQQALALVDPIERCSIEARCGWWPECGQ